MKNKNPSKVAAFPASVLTGALVLSIVVLVALAWFMWDSYRNVTTGQQHNLRIEELGGTVVHLDEVLTMSARMAATTGDSNWERRYRQFEPQLDAAIKEAMLLTAHSDSAEAVAHTDAANLKLVEMENLSFDLVRAGKAAQAKAVLFSDAYEAQKKIYADGMGRLIQHLNEQLAANLLKKKYEAIFSIIAVVCCIVLFLFAWLSVVRRLNYWRMMQAASLEVLTRAEEVQRSQKRLRDLIDGLGPSMFVGLMTPQGIVLEVNRSSLKAAGLTLEDVLGKPFAQTHWWSHSPQAQGRLREAIARAAQGEASRYDVQARGAGNDLIDIDFSLRPLRDETGEVVFLIPSANVITERKRSEAALEKAHRELVAASRQAGMAEMATNVLHNVGNILNSVNVSADLLGSTLRTSRAQGLSRAVQLMDEHAADLGGFLTRDDKGRLLPAYLGQLAQALAAEQQGMAEELARLTRSIDHIKDVVATQQSYAGASSVIVPVQICDLAEDALRMNGGALARHQVTVVKEFAEVPVVLLDRVRVLQILVNLISNAKNAMSGMSGGSHQITLRVDVVAGSSLRVSVKDEGEGIPQENLTRIFAHGFSTRKAGHGFGLHSCALAARQMGGTLTAHSDGPGKGATFTLELPIDTAQAKP